MDEATSVDQDETMGRLKELVLDHLGIPRPGASQHLQQLQDQLLPSFMETARYAWLAASPMHPMPTPNDPIHQYFSGLPNRTLEIGKLNSILEELGVHDLLRDVADSSDVTALGSLPLDPYEERLLRAVGHPKPDMAALEYLRHVVQDPSLLASPSKKLEEAAQVTLNVHGDINVIINQPSAPPTPVPPAPQAPPGIVAPAPEKPKRRRLFSGLGKLFSGFVLLGGNTIVIPTVTIGSLIALPVLGSLAAGMAAVAEGIGHLRREGE
jgi:hypothetical protein